MNKKYASFCTLCGQRISTRVTSVGRGRSRPAALFLTISCRVSYASYIRLIFSSTLADGPLTKGDNSLVGSLQPEVGNCEDRRVDIGLVPVQDLDDVAIRERVEDFEDVGACRQDLGTYARYFDGSAKGDNSLSVQLVGLCIRRNDQAEDGKT